MKTNLRQYDRQIIEKGRRFLWGAKDGRPVWCSSLYDAWWDEENGGRYVPMVAKTVGGIVRTFNPITGDVKK